METITIKANKNKANIIKEFLDNQKVKYQTNSSKKAITENSPYDPEFVERVLKARNDNTGDRILTEEYKKELFGFV